MQWNKFDINDESTWPEPQKDVSVFIKDGNESSFVVAFFAKKFSVIIEDDLLGLEAPDWVEYEEKTNECYLQAGWYIDTCTPLDGFAVTHWMPLPEVPADKLEICRKMCGWG